jgi:2-keto-4-pentenoate hydratase/2-oxohepta-3-ene-1,7-dioic acid hydratase in catechol pathway
LKIARFHYQEKLRHGLVEGDNVHLIDNDIFAERIIKNPTPISIDKVRLLAPVSPGKIICVGLNYKDHAKELNMPIPDEPILFLKPHTSVIGPGDDIIYPDGVTRLDYEAELALVIKRQAKDISPDESADHILGYTCLNDITARDLQKKDGQWTRAKSFDTFCPIGPFIVTDIDARNLDIELFVNCQRRQHSSTSNLIFDTSFLVSFISRIMTLMPGDIIATGTPPGVGPLSPGDEVEVRISNIASLKNLVRDRSQGDRSEHKD